MSISKKRLQAAEERLLSRYPDRDKMEVDRAVNSFRGMSPSELRAKFEKEAERRGIQLNKSSQNQVETGRATCS